MDKDESILSEKVKIIDLNQIKLDYAFYYEGENSSGHYYCNCGKYFTHAGDAKEEKNNTPSIEVTPNQTISDKDKDYLHGKDYDFMSEFSEVYKVIRMAEDGVVCPKCGTNYSRDENRNKMVSVGNFFISGFEFIETETHVFLFYGKVKPEVSHTDESSNLPALSNQFIELKESYRYIKLDKLTKTLSFKDYDKLEREFDLEEVVQVVETFFTLDTTVVISLYKMHLFINRLANFVIDVSNINIVEELLSKMRNRHNDAGAEYIKRITSIFFGIIKYSNLSTIALTKGSNFLYDLMKECDIPNPEVLRRENVTSPIKIFNFLINNYNKKLNEEVNEDNKEAHEFTFKSSKMIKFEEESGEGEAEVIEGGEEKEASFKIKTHKDYKSGKVTKTSDGRFEVMDAIGDVAISKFIYNKINNFVEYKQLVKYLKFLNKGQLIEIIQKYDINLLTQAVDLLYFRDAIDLKELYRLFTLLHSYCEEKTWEFAPNLGSEQKINYQYLAGFEFTIYDDSIMMMEMLKFDRKRDFDKIKYYGDLIKYHNNLVKFFKVVSDNEKNKIFMDFVEKFKFLEDKTGYDGPLMFKLINTPGMLIREGVEMKHSASSYVSRVNSGQYVIGQIYDKSPDKPANELDRYTIGFDYNSLNGLEFNQIKGFANAEGSDRLKQLVMDWLTVKDISFRPIKDLMIKNR
jgi:hypothetical protein